MSLDVLTCIGILYDGLVNIKGYLSMYSEALIFLRFGCYVHNPDTIYTRASTPVLNWLDEIKAQDDEWGYKIEGSIVSLNVPSALHHALNEFDCDYIYTNPPSAVIRALLASKRNLLRLSDHNIRMFMKITKTTGSELIRVLESYLKRIEVNPIQPVTTEEIKCIKSLGVEWTLAGRLPRMDTGGFEPIYIIDEHHRVRCL